MPIKWKIFFAQPDILEEQLFDSGAAHFNHMPIFIFEGASIQNVKNMIIFRIEKCICRPNNKTSSFSSLYFIFGTVRCQLLKYSCTNIPGVLLNCFNRLVSFWIKLAFLCSSVSKTLFFNNHASQSHNICECYPISQNDIAGVKIIKNHTMGRFWPRRDQYRTLWRTLEKSSLDRCWVASGPPGSYHLPS